jgi:hypothetical protein
VAGGRYRAAIARSLAAIAAADPRAVTVAIAFNDRRPGDEPLFRLSMAG